MGVIFLWTLGDIILLTVIVFFLFIGFLFLAPTSIKQLLCKHNCGINETQACDAICRKCGKNLGFIGTLRDSYTLREP